MTPTPDLIRRALAALPNAPTHLFVAYSGGLDSLALLQLAADFAQSHSLPITALHVHHGLSPKADDWVQHCQQHCQRRQIPLAVEYLEFDARQNLEARARHARYTFFERHLNQPGHILLMGHHQQDQAETLLLRLMRSAGLEGLAGIPEKRPLGDGWLVRPLLNQTKASLQHWLEQHALDWIEDESNQSLAHDRNFIRHQILPSLESRFPHSQQRLAQSAHWLADSRSVMHEWLEEDLQHCLLRPHCLSIPQLQRYSPARWRHLLHYYLQQLQAPALPYKRWEAVSHLLSARPDGMPEVMWGDYAMRRYRDQLWIAPQHHFTALPEGWTQSWDGQSPLRTPIGVFTVDPIATESPSKATFLPGAYQATKRQGGEYIWIPHRGHVALKQWYQEAGIPPWERQRRPLIWSNGQLIAIGTPLNEP